jgi:uncharacterized protein YcfJ
LGSQAGNEIGRPTGWIGHDDAYGPVGVVGAVSGVRAGNERDTYDQGDKISTSHCNTGHSITSSARVAGGRNFETERLCGLEINHKLELRWLLDR